MLFGIILFTWGCTVFFFFGRCLSCLWRRTNICRGKSLPNSSLRGKTVPKCKIIYGKMVWWWWRGWCARKMQIQLEMDVISIANSKVYLRLRRFTLFFLGNWEVFQSLFVCFLVFCFVHQTKSGFYICGVLPDFEVVLAMFVFVFHSRISIPRANLMLFSSSREAFSGWFVGASLI